MIRIHRTNSAPANLRRLGSRQTESDCAAYEESPQQYRSHRQRFPDKEYYKKNYVKDILMRMHHKKCCYCETKRYTPSDLHVEHFRPKGAVRQSRADDNKYPGYYWLKYCWDNLLLACPDCNTCKNTVFPLEKPAQRARSHNDDLTRERERFVNPAAEDPRDHIRFVEDLPVARTERGRHTIEELGLRRSALTEQRRECIEAVKMAIVIIENAGAMPFPDNDALQNKARRIVEQAVQSDAAFSSMMIDFLAQRES